MSVLVKLQLIVFAAFLLLGENGPVCGLQSTNTCVLLYKSGNKIEYKCPVCGKTFKTQKSLLQHETDRRHFVKGSTADVHFYRRKFVLDFENTKVKVEEEDRKKSVNLTKSILDSLLKEIRNYSGGKIYSPAIRRAGSYAVNTKIGKADEFDTNIVLNVQVAEIRTSGDLGYIFEDKVHLKKGPSSPNLNTDRRLVDHANVSIPSGQASVRLGHDVVTNLTYHGDLIPFKVKKDLYRKLQKALNVSSFKGVHLYRAAHGPALTLTIMQQGDHHISVDLTTSIPCNLSVTRGGWPRPDTRKALSQSLINATIAVGMHLVPKGDETWSISYSKAERKLMESVDAGHGCRRRVMKMMKRHVQIAASRAGFKLVGISSHIIKNQVLWSSEKRYINNYWNEINLDVCMLDTMLDLVVSLRNASLPGYFNSDENILSGKNRTILNYLADYFEQERKHILSM
ncbi:hypothetical protein FSP39_021705 [Pinctada imbricata]|uniref:C2H2-type domain-containing protein n=1 Tax=Pinctada imbricata TaxID=66713 RepID=A0AA88YEB6_PINIB|nr:hypothetical protein FSP39_021705 [Pinctada imbricata]